MRKTLRIKKKNSRAIPKNCKKWVLRKNLTFSSMSQNLQKIRENFWRNFWENLRNISTRVDPRFVSLSFAMRFYLLFSTGLYTRECLLNRRVRQEPHMVGVAGVWGYWRRVNSCTLIRTRGSWARRWEFPNDCGDGVVTLVDGYRRRAVIRQTW